jgi:hypothetical protein
MKALHRGRPAQMVMLSALLSWSAAAPAVADEVTYLTYLKGTEGKVAPFRVQWNEVGDAKGRITIDLGTPYEAWLKKLGLERVQAFDAKLNRQEFVVRDPLLTRFVTIVASDLVRGAQTNVLPGVTPITTGAQVEGAVLLITPAPDNLEVIARLHVTYPVPQKSAPPVIKDLVSGDLIFLGQPEPKGANPKPR